MGVPLLYCSDSYADDLPYWVQDPLTLDGEEDKGMLMVSYPTSAVPSMMQDKLI